MPVDLQRESRLPGYIRERSVLIVVIERGKGFAGLVARPVHGIDEQNVLPAVIVVVKKAGAAAHGFRQILFSEGSGVVFEVDSGLGSHIGELDWAGRAGRSGAGSRCGRWFCGQEREPLAQGWRMAAGEAS